MTVPAEDSFDALFRGNRVVAHTGARYPVLQAPMTWIARAPLVSAVSAAGALGMLETTLCDFDAITREFRAIRERTANPFGVSLPVRFLKRDPVNESRILDWLLGNGLQLVTTAAGDPSRYVATLKKADVTVYHAVPSLRAALKAAEAGVDGLVVEGAESAGIRNEEEIHNFVLLQLVREHVSLPLIAAGGIVDGRGMAAAFALGAEGVAMGTRFVASHESPVHPNFKAAIVAAPALATSLAPFPPRANLRTLRLPETVSKVDEPSAASDLIERVYIAGETTRAAGPAGESAALVHDVRTVAEIIEETVRGFRHVIQQLNCRSSELPMLIRLLSALSGN